MRTLLDSGGWPESDLSGTTCPATDLPEFDSLNAAEATVLIEECIGEAVAIIPLWDVPNGRALTIDEITDAICKEIGEARK